MKSAAQTVDDSRYMVIELLKEPTGPAREDDRRQSRRHTVTLPATLTATDGTGRCLDVRVHDISLHGAGLRSDVPLTTGEEFFLDIGVGLLKLHARVRIANARARRDGAWAAGAVFSSVE